MKKILFSCLLALGIGANAQITLGGTSTTTGQVPIDNNYGYSYTQQIFLKSDIKADAAGNITGLKFYLPTAAVLTNSSSWVVYIGHTTKTTFSSTTDWVPVSASTLTEVFNGTVSNSSGVVEITFASPFAYNNVDNLIVAVDENTANYDATSNRFYNYTGVTNSSIYYRSDTVNPDPLAITQTGTRVAQKSRITLLGLTTSVPDCPAVSSPATNATNVSSTPTITWAAANNATGYKLTVGTTTGGTDILNSVDLGNVTSYTFSSALSPNTKYFYSVNSYNATMASSGCGERSFTTACTTSSIPYSQNFESAVVPAAPSCTAIQNAGTGNNWVTYSFTTAQYGFPIGKSLRYSYNTVSAANTWFYTQGLNLVGGTSYTLSFRSGSNNAGYTEKLKVAYGTSAVNTAMTNLIVDYPEVDKGTSSVKKVLFTPATDGVYYIGFNAYSDADQDNLYLDDISVDLAPTTAPECSTTTSPANGSTDISVRPSITWSNAVNAFSYKLYLGTTPGGNDVLNGIAANSGYTLASNAILAANTTYYLKVVPTNNIGDATCTETSFTTGANPLAPYCGPMVSSAPTQMTPITSVTFNGVTNASDTSATTFGSFPANESFLSTFIEVKNDLTTVPFSVTGIGITGNSWATSVFIDWNNDNDFLDAGEAYFNTTATMKSTSTVTGGKATLTGDIAIPSGVTLGEKRMRVKYNFTGTVSLNLPLTNACEDLTNGQVEDYTITVTDATLAVSDANKAKVSVYPNPFTDILKISDIKGVKSISVSDISGREVKTLAPSTELNLSNLKAGLYIVTLKMEDESVKTFKTIKK